jgi:hypothetical protein
MVPATVLWEWTSRTIHPVPRDSWPPSFPLKEPTFLDGGVFFFLFGPPARKCGAFSNHPARANHPCVSPFRATIKP